MQEITTFTITFINDNDLRSLETLNTLKDLKTLKALNDFKLMADDIT
jgi:hypothetical protein